MNVVANMAVLPMTMMLDVALRIKERYRDH